MTKSGERVVYAVSAVGLGVALSYVMYRWLPPSTNPSPGQTKIWIVPATSFAGLALVILAGVRRSATALGWIALAALTVLAYGVSRYSYRWGFGSPSLLLGFQVFYGVVVLGHLLLFRGPASRPAESTGPSHNAKSARRLGRILLVVTVIAALPCLLPWNDTTRSVVEFCIAVIVPLWLSSAYYLVLWARDRVSRWAATGWIAATMLCLPLLFLGVLISHISLPAGD